MTKTEALQTLRRLQETTDTEAAHEEADDVLCALLLSLGYGDVVEEWFLVGRGYL